jgi:hypothetical protein
MAQVEEHLPSKHEALSLNLKLLKHKNPKQKENSKESLLFTWFF